MLDEEHEGLLGCQSTRLLSQKTVSPRPRAQGPVQSLLTDRQTDRPDWQPGGPPAMPLEPRGSIPWHGMPQSCPNVKDRQGTSPAQRQGRRGGGEGEGYEFPFAQTPARTPKYAAKKRHTFGMREQESEREESSSSIAKGGDPCLRGWGYSSGSARVAKSQHCLPGWLAGFLAASRAR